MSAWIIPVTIIILALIALSLIRIRIPRDQGKEGKDNFESVQAYDQISGSILFCFFRSIVIRQLKKYRPQNILLDIGCGPGYLAAAIGRSFPLLKVIGIDYSKDMIKLARKNFSSEESANNSNIFFQEANVNDLPFPSNSLDFLVSTLSLHHWPSVNQALRELYRVLKPTGQLLIFDLRRDEPLLIYYAGHFVQHFLSPGPIDQVNGAIGSIWSSYTPPEMNSLISNTSFEQWSVKKGWAWVYVWAKK